MTEIVITRNQYEKLKEVFEMYETLDYVIWRQSSPSGIGPTVEIEFDPKQSVKMDITDVSCW
jgi:hypothetical protein